MMTTLDSAASDFVSDFVKLVTYGCGLLAGRRELSCDRATAAVAVRNCKPADDSGAVSGSQPTGRKARRADRTLRKSSLVRSPPDGAVRQASFAQQKRPSDQHGWSEGLPNNPGRKCGPTLASRRPDVNAHDVPNLKLLGTISSSGLCVRPYRRKNKESLR